MKEQALKFVDKNDRIHMVKPRTGYQIYNFLKTYSNREYRYIPNSQFISVMNGNIYAKFIDPIYGNIETLMVADYKDYIKELKFK